MGAPQTSNPLTAIPALRDLLQKGPDTVYQQMYASNPDFRAFADSMSGKSPQEAFAEHGFDFGQIQQMFGR